MRLIQHPVLKNIDLAEVMHALSDPARLDILRQLARTKTGEKSCGELLDGRPKSSMSHHFKILRSAGLIETRTEGKEHINRVRMKEFEARFPGLLKTVLKNLGV